MPSTKLGHCDDVGCRGILLLADEADLDLHLVKCRSLAARSLLTVSWGEQGGSFSHVGHVEYEDNNEVATMVTLRFRNCGSAVRWPLASDVIDDNGSHPPYDMVSSMANPEHVAGNQM